LLLSSWLSVRMAVVVAAAVVPGVVLLSTMMVEMVK
jgi:hypothetical protein